MKNISLDLNEREHITLVLGQQTGRAGDVFVITKILDKIMLTSAEETAIGLTTDGNNLNWRMPPGIEPIDFQLEDTEYDKLKAVMTTWPNFMPRDNTWLQAVLKKLP